MTTTLDKQMKSEAVMHAAKIKKAVDAALNDKKTKADIQKLAKSGEWLPKPNKQILKHLEKVADTTWNKLKPKFDNNQAKITIVAREKKPPSCTVDFKFDVEWRGGKKVVVKPGDTIASMSAKVYGSEGYAAQVIEANRKDFNFSVDKISVMPAGFPLMFPKILVPTKTPPAGVCLPKAAKAKAVRIEAPGMTTKIDIQKAIAVAAPLGNVLIYVTLEGKGEVFAKKPNKYVDAGFNLKAHELELKRGLGPVESGFKVDLRRGKSATSLDVKVVNVKLGGLKFENSLNLKEGSFDLKLGSDAFKGIKIDGIEYSGNVTLTAKIRVIPNPKYRWFRIPEIGVREVALVTVGVTILAGGWAVIVGGATIKGLAVAGGLGLAVAVGNGGG